ncbi:MAG: helix-hairpin-helix domain-containing protein [Culicoidibacterales bacterium]
MQENIIAEIVKTLKIKESIVKTVLTLLEEGNTVHFLARYRKEQIGGIDEEVIREIESHHHYQKQLSERKMVIKKRIEEQGMLTEELSHSIDNCQKMVQLEQLYEPYKSKKITKAKLAIQGGLTPLAHQILAFENTNLEQLAHQFINDTFSSITEVLENVGYLIAQIVSEKLEIREAIKRHHLNFGKIIAKKTKKAGELDQQKVYEMYYDFNRAIKQIANHQILAINRAQKQKIVQINLQVDEQKVLDYLESQIIEYPKHQFADFISNSLQDASKRLILPSVQREIRTELTNNAESEAIKLFGHNVYQLLMQQPLEKQTILGFDPAFRTGCKMAVINEIGEVKEIAVIFPHVPQNKKQEAKQLLNKLYHEHHFSIIAIGNGTASRESEQFIVEWISEQEFPVQYTIVSEAGASVYSASKIAINEFPNLSVEQRSAISIARRLIDPLAELVKIDPKALGVGQYQHDLSQTELSGELGFTVDKAVNRVGVDINYASVELLQYVSGLNKTTAKNIVAYRTENGIFNTRKSFLKVKGFGKKAYEQSAGFLRIISGENLFDNTAIHPESYKMAEELLKKLGFSSNDIGTIELKEKISTMKKEDMMIETIDKYTLSAILDAFTHPFRDEREKFPAPILKKDVTSVEDLTIGLELEGVVRNITDFGAFIDIGIKNDGFVHVSKMSIKFINHPSQVVAIGDILTVYVENIDKEKQKVELTLLQTR